MLIGMGLSVCSGGGSLAAAVAALFAAGEQGGWWDPSDFSTMFQDSAGTTPVTAVTQPVGLIRDKSGRGNHRTQGTAASRPTLQQDASGFFYLSYDGVDDGNATAAINFSGTSQMTVWAGINKQSDAAAGAYVELSATSTTNDGSFLIAAPNGAAATYGVSIRGTVAASSQTLSGFAAPISNVLSVALDTGAAAASQIKARINAVAQAGGGATTAGNFGNFPLFFGERAGTSLPFSGREHQTIIRGATSTAAQIAAAERYVGSKMGIAL